MDKLEVEGGPVLMQLAQPCESSGRRAKLLLTHVKGEYEDEDGDWATGFIQADVELADPRRSANSAQILIDAQLLNYSDGAVLSEIEVREGPLLSKIEVRDGPLLSKIEVRELVDKDSPMKSLAGSPMSVSSPMDCDDSSEFTFPYRCGKTTLDYKNEPDDCYSLIRDRNGTDSETDMGPVSSAHKLRHYLGSREGEDESMSLEESFNRKNRLDNANLCCASDESDVGIFCCESCGQTLPLHSVYPMLSCDCLLCIPCCRRHVESSLSAATRRAGKRPDLRSGEDYQRTRDSRANSSSDATKTHKSDLVEDTYITEANLARFSQGETITASGEGGLDLYVELFPEESGACLDSISCPTLSCSGCLQLSGAQILAPQAFRKWEEAATHDLMEHCTSYINCPGCDIVIEKVASQLPPGVVPTGVPELDRTSPFPEFDCEGKQLSCSAICHRAAHRFRCSICSVEFCGACKNVPYHLGKTCEQFEEEKNCVKCFYCEIPIRPWRKEENILNSCSVRELRRELDRDDIDALWCIEKRELVEVQRFAASVCASKDCRKHLRMACTRNLDCGHHCGGVRGERICLPCLEDDCRSKVTVHSGDSHVPSADDLCSICLVEPLRRAPSIQLTCGHVVHMRCAQRKLEEGCPGPAISFGYLNCPLCPQVMQHSRLNSYTKKPLALLEQTKEKALTRLKAEGLSKSAKELKAGGAFEGQPTAFALHLYQYYMCCKCTTPYFGGQRDCAANDAEQNGNSYNPLNLVCGGCSAASRGQGICQKGHGKNFVEFKCKFCCSIATYFCFGHTHFCQSCHTTRPDNRRDFIPAQCKGPKWCPLRTTHAPNGQECCLGCSMCRLHGQ